MLIKWHKNHLTALGAVNNLGIKAGGGKIELLSDKTKNSLKMRSKKNKSLKLKVGDVALQSDTKQTNVELKNGMGVGVTNDIVQIHDNFAQISVKDKHKKGALVSVSNDSTAIETAGLSIGKEHGLFQIKDKKSGSKVNMFRTGDVDISTEDESSAVKIEGGALPDIEFQKKHIGMGFEGADIQAYSEGKGIEIDPKVEGTVDIDDGVMTIHIKDRKVYIRKKEGPTDAQVL